MGPPSASAQASLMNHQSYARYALFYTPAPGPFADFGAAWLGWDSAAGQQVEQPQIGGLDIVRLTARPRKYGFHATLKAPFYLADGQDQAALEDALDAFAAAHSRQPIGPLAVRADHGFLALRPIADQQGLRDLAAAVVRSFDTFRAPMSPEQLARRRQSRLTQRQDQHLVAFGYPFVFDDFHFHMTLTGPLRKTSGDDATAALNRALAPVLPNAPAVDAVTLLGQKNDGMFYQIRRAALRGD